MRIKPHLVCRIIVFDEPFACRDIDISISSSLLHEFSDKKRILFQLDALIRREGSDSGIIERNQVNHFARVPILIVHTTEQYGEHSATLPLHD